MRALVGLILFLLPTNLFLVLDHHAGYVNGLKIDYLLPKLYLSFAVVLVLLLSAAPKVLQLVTQLYAVSVRNRVAAMLAVMLVLYQVFLPSTMVSLMHLSIAIIVVLMSAVLIRNKTLLNSTEALAGIVSALVFQTVVGLHQFLTQSSVLGFYFFGEPDFTKVFGLHTAQLPLNLGERILAYGTTAHPNVLAGFAVIYSLLVLQHPRARRSLTSIAFILTIICLAITQSIASLTAFILGLTTLYALRTHPEIQKKLLSPTVIVGCVAAACIATSLFIAFAPINHHSIENRKQLQAAAIELARKNPIFGVGIQQFTQYVESISYTNSRFVQPAHNIFLVLFAETGLVGVVVLGLAGNSLWKHTTKQEQRKLLPILAALMPLALLDHYLYTLVPGLLLVGIAYSTTVSSTASTER